MQIFDLYWGSRLLTSVIMPKDSSDEQVRAKALKLHGMAPTISLIYGEMPFEFEFRLRRAKVSQLNSEK